MAYVITPELAPTSTQGRGSPVVQTSVTSCGPRLSTGLSLDGRSLPTPAQLLPRQDLRGRGEQVGLAFVKLDLGAGSVDTGHPSLPWMHPGAWKTH